MERLVEMEIAKFNILSILDCYYRLFPLIYISHDSEGITFKGPAVPAGSCEERKIWQPLSSPETLLNIMNEKNLCVAGSLHLGKLGGRCVSIEVIKMDSWRVKNVFKSNNRVSNEAISSYVFKLMDHPKITEYII